MNHKLCNGPPMKQTNAKNEITLDIESLSYGVYGVGRFQGQVILVPATVPGDRVLARIVEKKSNYAIGKVLRVIRTSGCRQKPPCPYLPDCGGCPWQATSYQAQLDAKQKNLDDALRRIGKLSNFDVRPVLPSPDEYGYRRRIRLQVDESKRVGLFKAESHDLVEIDSCLITAHQANLHIKALRLLVQKMSTRLGAVEIVAGEQPREIVIVVTAAEKLVGVDENVISSWLKENPGVAGLIVTGPGTRRVWGHTAISITTEPEIRLVVEADVFTQVNPAGNRCLVNELLAAGEFAGADRVLELYSGAGNFTLSIAKRAGRTIAVEENEQAVASGQLSARLNRIDNIRWIKSHASAAVKRLARRGEKFSKIVLDPPRAGAKGIVRDLARFEAEKIFYVSCNPTTLARDLSGLVQHGYQLNVVQPVDLFPHTFHVEALAVLHKL
jgi:23S rRNA (uracil1939-C5)-methyltransferase